jgi:hypothetical protein
MLTHYSIGSVVKGNRASKRRKTKTEQDVELPSTRPWPDIDLGSIASVAEDIVLHLVRL